MSVHPNFRGLGIGKIMLEALIDWAQANPRLETVRLRVHSKNETAISLYQSCGFRVEGREIRGVKIDENQYDDVILMARDVMSSES